MDKEQKTLKSPLSAKFCNECMAKVAGEAQKSLARAILMDIEDALKPMIAARDFLKDFLGKPK